MHTVPALAAVAAILCGPASAQSRLDLIEDAVQVLHATALTDGVYVGWPYTAAPLLEPSKRPRHIAVTALAGELLVHAPGWSLDPARAAAVEGATWFLLDTPLDLLRAEDEAREALALAYGLRFLRSVLAEGRGPAGTEAAVTARIMEYVDAMETGLQRRPGKEVGWSYDSGDAYSDRACFFTAPVVLSLVEAYAEGWDVCPGAVRAGLDYLEASRLADGSFHYLGTGPLSTWPPGDIEVPKSTPEGSAARTPSGELALWMWGGSSPADLVTGVSRFFLHWDLLTLGLDPVTYVPPATCPHNPMNFFIGCFYVLYGHYHTAGAVEHLPEPDRTQRRDELFAHLAALQQTDGSWFDMQGTRSAGTALAGLALLLPLLPPTPRVPVQPSSDFVRGDVNRSGMVDVTDAVVLLEHLFGDGEVCPWDAADVNDDGAIDIADSVYLLAYLFEGGPTPPAPFPGSGADPTPDDY